MMKEVTVKNYQELAMRTCLPSAKNWKYCYCLIASEIGEAFGKWGKLFRDGDFDKNKLADELGNVFWGLALACELGEYKFEELWRTRKCYNALSVWFYAPQKFDTCSLKISEYELKQIFSFLKELAEQCGIKPIKCLRCNIIKLAGRKERGTIGGNGDDR